MSMRVRYTAYVSLLLAGLAVFPVRASPLTQAAVDCSKALGGADLAFEVATIRPANAEDGRNWFGVRLDASGRLQASAVGLETLVSMAYRSGSTKYRVTVAAAAPKWVSSQRFDIQAKVDDACMGRWDKMSEEDRMDVVRPMIRRLLTDRFHTKLGVETQTVQVYALVPAKGGAHVKEVTLPAPMAGETDAQAQARWFRETPGKAFPGTITCSAGKCEGHAVRISAVLGQIAANSHADRMVVDETGLTGYYDLSFAFPSAKDEFPMQEVGDDLGMKFVPRSVPMATYVIESAEKPNLDGQE